MKQFDTQARLRAMVLFCLFRQVGKAPLTVGQVLDYVIEHGQIRPSAFRVQKAIDTLIGEGAISVSKSKHGAFQRRQYHLSQTGALKLVSEQDNLPTAILKFMRQTLKRAADAAAAVLLEAAGEDNARDN